VARAGEVVVVAAGKVQVGVVKLSERDPKRRLKLSVDVEHDHEPLFGLLVLANRGGGPGELPVGAWTSLLIGVNSPPWR